MELVEPEESVEPVEVRIVDVVFKCSSLSECVLSLFEARIASHGCSKIEDGIDRDARTRLWVANFSTTRARSTVVVHWTARTLEC